MALTNKTQLLHHNYVFVYKTKTPIGDLVTTDNGGNMLTASDKNKKPRYWTLKTFFRGIYTRV